MREPFNVLVIPYVKRNGSLLFCVFKRRDMQIWQFVAGGIESGETFEDAAIRELVEETGVSSWFESYQLDSVASVRADIFKQYYQKSWPKDVFVVQCVAFAVELKNQKIELSDEHLEYKWLEYSQAHKLLKYDFDKTALWELNERIKFRFR